MPTFPATSLTWRRIARLESKIVLREMEQLDCYRVNKRFQSVSRGKLDVIEWAMMRVINHIARIYQICHAFLTLAYIWH